MELKRIDKKTPARAARVLGLAAAACAACCVSLPLLAPVLVWFGFAGLGAAATGWYLGAAGIFAAGLGAALFIHRRRRAVMSLRAQSGGSCGCATSCKT